MKKRLFRSLTILLLTTMIAAITVSGNVFAAEELFHKTNTYEFGSFTDLQEDKWYYNDIISAYEIGLMTGMGEGIFMPEGTLSVAQAITVSARIHSIYNGKGDSFEQGNPWYATYVDYAIENNFLSENEFEDYNRDILRSEMANLIAKALPKEYYPSINNVVSIPDLLQNSRFWDSTILLYNAGIIMGNDDYGTFYPNANIKRSEVSAIINRVAFPEKRLVKELLDPPVSAAKAPLYLIDDQNMPSASNYGQYGWDFDNRGGIAGSVVYAINDISKTERVALVRKITPQSEGCLTLETVFSTITADNGFYIYLGKDEDVTAFKIISSDGYYFVDENGELKATNVALKKGLTYLKADVDIDSQTTQLYIDGIYIGTYGFAEYCDNISQFMYASTEKDIVNASVKYTKLHTNYAVNEMFIAEPVDVFPSGWDFDATEGSQAVVEFHDMSRYDGNGMTIRVPSGGNAVLSKTFAPISHKVCFEAKFYMPQPVNGTTFSLKSAGNSIFDFIIDENILKDKNGNILRAFNPEVWQTLRVEANTQTGKAVLKINMKTVMETDFDVTYFDGLSVKTGGDRAVELLVDDFYVYNLFDESSDYVPTPVPAESNGYYIALETCDIWRNGFHYGWDYVSPFEEMTPYLGYFDEGSSEVADWETKWMVENGVTFRLVCWYGGNGSGPLKTPRNSFGHNNGYMNGKYSDMMKFALMWENSSNLPKNSEEFRKYLVPYWIEYYFTDDRYMTIDNKLVMSIYRRTTLLDMFGSVEKVKTEIDYLRKVATDLGFDGAIILTTGGTSDTTQLEEAKAMGFDGIYAYNWGRTADIPENQIRSITSQNDKGIIDTIPTIAVGFNDVPLIGERSTNISVENYISMFKWVKNEFLSKRSDDSWKSKMVVLSNWNEFGEGHYLMPSALNGFGYMNAIRQEFTIGEKTENVAPDESARVRFNSLFPQDRKVIRRLCWETEEVDYSSLSPTLTWDFSNSEDRKEWKSQFGIINYKETETSINGESERGDFAIIMAEKMQHNLDGGAYVHVRMKNTLDSGDLTSRCQVFFISEAHKEYNDAKEVKYEIIADGKFHDYYINMGANQHWNGIITQLRFDPMMDPGKFEIEKIEIMRESQLAKLFINEIQIRLDFTPIIENNQFMVAINPYSSIFNKMNVYHTWNSLTKTLTMSANGHTVVMTMDSTTAIVDGQAKTMYAAPFIRDGLPTIPFDFLIDNLDFTLDIDGMDYKVFSISNDYAEVLKQRKNYEWNFDIPGDMEGWSISNASLKEHSDGVIHFDSLSNGKRHDPMIMSPEFLIEAADYDKIIVKMSHKLEEVDKAQATIFFRTSGTSYDAVKVATSDITSKSSNGEFIEYVFDMKQNELWTGKVISIRFDPFDAIGSFSIDSIQIIKND